jgi:maleate isomerase
MNAVSDIRVGVMVPAGNVIHEREFQALRPSGVTFRFTHFVNPDMSSPTVHADLTDSLGEPLSFLRDWGAHVVLLGCTAASMTCAGDDFRRSLEAIALAPVVTAASAATDAIRALNLQTIAVATPYGEAGNRIVTNFLEGQGTAVASIKGMALDRSPDIWSATAPFLTSEDIMEFSLTADCVEAEAMYMPCTAINSLGALAPFEQRTGKPAFSSVQAGYWAALRRVGFDGRRSGYGRLVEQWDFDLLNPPAAAP